MPKIETKKDEVLLLNDPNPSNIAFSVGPGIVMMTIRNEGVNHNCLFSTDELQGMAVACIKLCAQAEAMAAHKAQQQQAKNIEGVIHFPRKQ